MSSRYCVCEIVLGQGCSSSAKLMTTLPRSTVSPNFKVRKVRRPRLLPGNTLLFLKELCSEQYTLEADVKKGAEVTVGHTKRRG